MNLFRSLIAFFSSATLLFILTPNTLIAQTEWHYPFDNDATETSGNQNGTLVDAPASIANRLTQSDKAYSFDGSNDGITIPFEVMNNTESGTIALWIKYDDFGGQNARNRTLIAKAGSANSQFGLYCRSSRFIFEAYNNGSGNFLEIDYNFGSNPDFSDDNWHHLAVTYSATEAKLYVDGALRASDNTTNGTYTSSSTNPISVGAPTNGQDRYFEGEMDELRLYKRVLTHEEIIAIGDATNFKSFTVAVAGELFEAVIDSTNHTVDVAWQHVLASGDISFTLYTGATGSPSSPLSSNIIPFTITITDHDGDAQAWTINSAYYESDIVSFSIEDELIPSAIDAGNHTVTIYMPYGTDLTSLSPIIGVSSGATIEPATGAGQNFSSVVTFTVTALDGEVQDWTCTVIEACFETETTVSPPATWHRDQDEDGFGDPSNSVVQCDQPEGYVLDNTDCNDENPELNPETIWYADTDGDGFGDLSNTTESCEQPTGFVANSLDCEDSNPGITSNWYVDGDADGYGSRAPAGVSDLLGQFTGAGPDDLALWEIAFLGDHIYVGGFITGVNGIAAGRMAKYNTVTESWSGMGIQFNSIVNSIVPVGDDLYIGGWFTNAAGIASADRLVKYNTITNTWSSVGGGLDNQGIRSMVVVGSELYIGGQFYDAKGITGADHIVKYDLVTEQWSALDGGIDGIKINEIISFNDEYLFVSGRFDQAGEIPNTQNIASYHIPTETWSALGEGISNPVEDVEYHTSGLYATSLRGGKAEIILFDFENQTWTTIYTGPIARNRPSVIHSIGDDIYFTIDGLGVMHYNPSGTDITLLPGTNGAYMHEMQADSEGNLFFSRSNDFWRYPTRAKSCEQVVLTGIATVNNSLDCDDTSDLISPETVWYQDSDGDEYGDPSNTLTQCDQPQGYVLDNTDCDDNNPNVFPGQTWYADTDEDGFGDAGSTRVQCEQPTNYVINDQDCNDNDEFINPDAEDIENGIDDNCNGYVDDDNSFLTFSMPEQIFSSIDYENHTVTVLFPGNYSGLNQTMTYTISPGASISPEEGYSDVQIGEIVGFDITSPDQRVQQWNVELKEGLNNESDITSFEVYNQIGTSIIDPENHTISFEILHQPSLTFTPIIELSYMATVNPLSGEAVDFSSPITYSVTAEDGVTFQDWEVTANTVPILSLYYPFNGNADEELGSNQNGSFPNESPALTSGHLGDENSAYLFDRNNDVIELSSDILNGSLQGTLAAWVKFSNISGGGTPNNTIIGKGSDTDSQFGLFAGNNDFLFENYNNGNGAFLSIRYDFQSAGEDFSDGNWHHIAATFSETNAVLYVDGIPRAVDETTNGVYTNTSTNQITIGNWGSDRNDPFRGAIDEVRIYNYALSAYEIGAIACLTEDVDNDGDGTSSCADCDDTDPDVQNTTWYADTDGDGFGNPTVSLIQCDQPQGFVANDSDCNDDYIEVKPRSGYLDADGDGYGAIDSELIDYCGDGEGYSENDYDQDDSDKDIWLDDGSVCTIDSFSEEMGPIYAPLNCDDNNACTIDSCDPIEGCINTPVDCDDGDPSTIDLCNSISGCYYIPVSIATSVSTFSINDVEGVIDTENHEITIQADAGTFDLAAITADFTIRSGATAKIAGEIKESGDQLNPYTTPFIMTVIAEDGITSQDWTVTINIPPSVNSISPNAAVVGTRLLIDGSNFDPTSNTVTIDGLNANVHSSSRTSLSVDVPEAAFGKDLDVSVTSRGQTTTLVGAFDVISINTDILSFAINEMFAQVDALNHTIELNLPAGTNLSTLSPTLSLSEGATVIPESVVAQNFTNPVIYTVTAEDGSTTQDWTVTVTEQLASPTDITLNAAVLPENQEPGFVIGQLTTTDPSFDDTHIYDIVSVDGQTSSTLFIIESNILKSNTLFDFESGESYALLIKTTDQNGGDFEKTLVINIENDADEDGFTISTGDCDDEDPNEYPNQIWYADSDGDGFGDANILLMQCVQPVNYVLNADDCDDTDAKVSPEMAWYADADGDGFGDANCILIQCEQPANYVLNSTDCDDSDADKYPNQIWYADVDGDGFGDPNTALSQCLQPSNYVLNNTDCDDTNANKNLIHIWFADSDGDGYGNPALSLTQCTPPANYVLNAEDCDDTNLDISPEKIWYADTDGDGFGDASKIRSQCEQPDRYVLDDTDCDDRDADKNPNQTWYADTDGDGFGDENIVLIQCEQPADYVLNADDCDDTDADVSPEMTWYADTDGDGYGDPDNSLTQCEQPANFISDNTDCDDSDANINPSLIWYADVDGDGFGDAITILTQCVQPVNFVLDNTDCDDTKANLSPETIWYADADGDGFGDSNTMLTQCVQPTNYVLNADDCDDAVSELSPETIWYADIDDDGFGDANTMVTQCAQPENYVLNADDCDDTDPTASPITKWYSDADGDGFGDESNTLTQCEQPANFVLDRTDCDDTDANANPNQTWFADVDGDGFGDENSMLTQCTPPANYVLNAADCDDTDANISPETIWYEDADGDGFGDENTFLTQCEQPEGYTLDFMLIPLGNVTTIEDEIKVYCSNNVLFINLPISNQFRWSFSVYNLSGKMLLETSSANSTSVNLDGMTPGVYLVKQAGSTLSYKIFIQ